MSPPHPRTLIETRKMRLTGLGLLHFSNFWRKYMTPILLQVGFLSGSLSSAGGSFVSHAEAIGEIMLRYYHRYLGAKGILIGKNLC